MLYKRGEPGSHYRNPHGVNMDDGFRPDVPDIVLEDQFKRGGIQVASGGAAWPLRMNLTDIAIEDIAHSLSMKVRYTGHCTEQYSIAQHSCHVCDLTPDEDKHEALMHDANEYVLPDVSAPVKSDPDFRAFWKPIEHQAERAIAKRFNLRWPWPPSVKYADNQMAWFEKSKIMLPPKYPWMKWTIPVVPMPDLPDFEVWDWRRAKHEFLARAGRLHIT